MHVPPEPLRGAPHSYFDSRFNRPAAKILPGEFHVSDEDMLLVTVLGSCVAACIRDPISGVGGMNHFMLPDRGEAETGLCTPSARYGVHAMEMLLNALLKRGARRSRLEIKVFGGGEVLPGMRSSRIGGRNADFVLDYLERERLPLAASDLRDEHGRKILYFPRTGRVLVRRLPTVHDPVLQREVDYSRRLAATPITGSVELF